MVLPAQPLIRTGTSLHRGRCPPNLLAGFVFLEKRSIGRGHRFVRSSVATNDRTGGAPVNEQSTEASEKEIEDLEVTGQEAAEQVKGGERPTGTDTTGSGSVVGPYRTLSRPWPAFRALPELPQSFLFRPPARARAKASSLEQVARRSCAGTAVPARATGSGEQSPCACEGRVARLIPRPSHLQLPSLRLTESLVFMLPEIEHHLCGAQG